MGRFPYLIVLQRALIASIFFGWSTNQLFVEAHTTHQPIVRSSTNFNNVLHAELQAARSIVEKALQDWAVVTKSRFEAPSRNTYTFKKDTEPRALEVIAPEITDEIRAAAALIAEFDQASNPTNTAQTASDFNARKDKRQPDNFGWRQSSA